MKVVDSESSLIGFPWLEYVFTKSGIFSSNPSTMNDKAAWMMALSFFAPYGGPPQQTTKCCIILRSLLT